MKARSPRWHTACCFQVPTRREGRTCKQLLATTQRLSRSIGRICKPRDAINVAPKCIRSRFSNRIYRVTGAAAVGSTPRSESCATPSLICAISPKLCCELPTGEALLDEPAYAPTRAGSSLPSSQLTNPSPLLKKRALDQHRFRRALFMSSTRYRRAVGIEPLVCFIRSGADPRHDQRFRAGVAKLIV